MDEFDQDGWSHIHHAASNGYKKSISRFVKSNSEQLELLTRDGKNSTPLLLACSNGNVDTVQYLIELGADQTITDAAGFGVIELSAVSGHVNILDYLISSGQTSVYKTLVSDLDFTRGKCLQLSCLKMLTELSKPEQIEVILDHGALAAVLKILDNPGSNKDALLHSLYFIEKTVGSERARSLVKKLRGIQIIVDQLNCDVTDVYFMGVKLLTQLSQNDEDAVQEIASNKGIEKLLSILEKPSQTDNIVMAVLNTLMLFCDVSCETQEVVAGINGSFKVLVKLLKERKKKRVLACLAQTVTKLVQGNHTNQDLFIGEDGISALIPMLSRSKKNEPQMSGVSAIKAIAHEGSRTNQELLRQEGCVKILTKLLREGSRREEVRQLLGNALWAIAGNDLEAKYMVAKSIGIGILIEFLKALSPNLNFIGSEALVVLAEHIHSKKDDIVSSSAVQFLVRLISLSSTPTQTVLSIFQVFQALCTQAGFRPHIAGQHVIMKEGGIKFVVRYLTHARKPLVQARAAYTLSCVSLGNHETNTLIVNLFEFSHLIHLLSDNDRDVCLTTGSALALFAFNNTYNQKMMAKSNTLYYSKFQNFFDSDNDSTLANAAFQIVVLARVFPDQEQATTSATGIKLLARLLEKPDEYIQGLCCNFIAGLAHTRPGIPSAFVSIGTIYSLARLLMSSDPNVQSCSAIALGYLSFDNHGQRQLLSVCRSNPMLYESLCHHAKKVRLSQEFIDRWKHYKNLLCLPPVKRGVCLINQDESDEILTVTGHLSENFEDSEDESDSESSETVLPMLLQ